MANQFYNGNIPVPGGCGVGQAPLVGTYNYTPSCPTGPGAFNPTVPSQTTLLSAGSSRTIRFTVANTTATSIFLQLGPDQSDACEDFVFDEAGVVDPVIVDADSTIVTMNRNAIIAHCAWDGTLIGFGIFVRPNDEDVTSVRVIQAVWNICDNCPTNDVELPCTEDCNGNSMFWGNGFFAGRNAVAYVEIPAGTTTVVELCGCVQESVNLTSCPALVPTLTPIPQAPYCPPGVEYGAQPLLAGNNGVQAFTGNVNGNRQF